MTIPMPTRKELLAWAPQAKAEYITSLVALEPELRAAGLLDHELALCHFLGQVGAETNGLTIVRESMNYRSVERIRQVWPARTRKLSDSYIKMNLVGNPVALADFAYGGRMGNAKGSEDGFLYRGGGPMQTTGKSACVAYCKALGVPFAPDVLDDIALTWRFAIHEWKTSGCQKYALQNDILSVSKIINTGSAASNIPPNGLDHRKRWLKRAWSVWGDASRPKVPEVADLTVTKLKQAGSETISLSDAIKKGAAAGGVVSAITGAASESGVVETVPKVGTQDLIDSLRQGSESVDAVTAFVQSVKGFWLLLCTNIWVLGLVLAIGAYWYAKRIDWRRLIDARLGTNISRLDQTGLVDDRVIENSDEAVIARV